MFGTMKMFLVLTFCISPSYFAWSDPRKEKILVTKIPNNIQRDSIAHERILRTEDYYRSLQQDTCSSKLEALSDCLTTTYECDSNCVTGATQSFMDDHNFTCASFKSTYCPAVAACGCRICYEEITDYYTCSSSDCDYQCISSTSSNGGISIGLIIAAIGGSVIFLGIIVCAFYCWRRKKVQRKQNRSSEKENRMECSPWNTSPQGPPVALMPDIYNSQPGITPNVPQMQSIRIDNLPGTYNGEYPMPSKHNQQPYNNTSASEKSKFTAETKVNDQPEEQYYIRSPRYTPTAKDQCRTLLTPSNGEAELVEASPVMDVALSVSNFCRIV